MTVAYQVRAQVVDLRRDVPKRTDRFWVDTNVWFWTVYSRIGLSPKQPQSYQKRCYPNYLKLALKVGAELHWSGLSLSELAHRIEKTEFDIYRQTPAGASLTDKQFKEYRHNLPDERKKVMQEVETAWQAVASMGKPLDKPVVIDGASTDAALQHLKISTLDGYDLFALRAVLASGISQVLSDDGDFCSVEKITLFTANRTVLTAAQNQGKLIIR